MYRPRLWNQIGQSFRLDSRLWRNMCEYLNFKVRGPSSILRKPERRNQRPRPRDTQDGLWITCRSPVLHPKTPHNTRIGQFSSVQLESFSSPGLMAFPCWRHLHSLPLPAPSWVVVAAPSGNLFVLSRIYTCQGF